MDEERKIMTDKLKKHKKLFMMFSIISVTIILTACTRRAQQAPIGPDYSGIWEGIIWYFSRFIIWSSELLGGNYGIGIIAITILSRLLLIPLTNSQQKHMSKWSEIQPEINKLKETYSANDSETRRMLQEETQKIYDKYDVKPMMGCLPMLVQMPIFIAVYSAVSRTPELANEQFLWVNLGDPDPYMILPILAGAFMFMSTYLMQMSREDSGLAGKVMSFIMPIFIIAITVNLSSGLALYFVVSNVFAVAQTLLLNNPFKKRQEARQAAREQEEARRRRKQALKKAVKYGRNMKK